MIGIQKGLSLPISGKPRQQIEAGNLVQRVALLGRDYPGLKPTLLVQEGDRVKLGQPLFSDKKCPQILYTSPGCGVVSAINRAERRAFVSIVIDLEGDDQVTFPVFTPSRIAALSSEDIEQSLLVSGLWPAFKTRPFSRVPLPATRPAAIFVTAMDTNPLAADPAVIINEKKELFKAGLTVLRPLTSGKVYLCRAEGTEIQAPEGVTDAVFSGPHPAGLPGTHIHFLQPVDVKRQVWHIGYQDVIAVGALFVTGRVDTERIISLAGPQVVQPRLVRTRLGADLDELTGNELVAGDNRIISGSVLSGYQASSGIAFLGRYHNQVSVIVEERQRNLLEWLTPGFGTFSIKPLFASILLARREMPFGSNQHGSLRAMVPIGAFEKVMPLDLEITWLLRSLLAGDTEMAAALGALELDEEDLALCSYVCSGKIDYGTYLRRVLNTIEEEGI